MPRPFVNVRHRESSSAPTRGVAFVCRADDRVALLTRAAHRGSTCPSSQESSIAQGLCPWTSRSHRRSVSPPLAADACQMFGCLRPSRMSAAVWPSVPAPLLPFGEDSFPLVQRLLIHPLGDITSPRLVLCRCVVWARLRPSRIGCIAVHFIVVLSVRLFVSSSRCLHLVLRPSAPHPAAVRTCPVAVRPSDTGSSIRMWASPVLIHLSRRRPDGFIRLPFSCGQQGCGDPDTISSAQGQRPQGSPIYQLCLQQWVLLCFCASARCCHGGNCSAAAIHPTLLVLG